MYTALRSTAVTLIGILEQPLVNDPEMPDPFSSVPD